MVCSKSGPDCSVPNKCTQPAKSDLIQHFATIGCTTWSTLVCVIAAGVRILVYHYMMLLRILVCHYIMLFIVFAAIHSYSLNAWLMIVRSVSQYACLSL